MRPGFVASTTGPRAVRALLAAGALLAGLTSGAEARAWYFPEHVVLTHDGLMGLPPEIRAVIQDAAARARAGGVTLCPSIDPPLEDVALARPLETRMIRSEISVECVPYAALSALAGDHASSAAELAKVLGSRKGVEIASAAAFVWNHFREQLALLPNSSLERMAFVHELDVAFYFIDPGYEKRAQATRAHFIDAGRPLLDVVRAAADTGDVDNSLGQFLVHHLRSLQLATQGRTAEALLEHGFALHFLQDAFSAGHLVMTTQTWKNGTDRARARHDYFDAKGLAVGRATRVDPCSTLEAGLQTGLLPCWMTTGDGHLGLSADASDRQHAARAVTQAELQLALALDPARVLAAVEALGERQQLELGELVEPLSWWSVPAAVRRTLRASAERTLKLVRGQVAAIARLRTSTPIPEVVVGRPVPSLPFEATLLDDATEPCGPSERADGPPLAEVEPGRCGASGSLAVGTVGVSLLLPLLSAWPASQVDPSTLHGESNRDLGWAAQLLAGASVSAVFPSKSVVDFVAPTVGVAAGLSYRWGTYLPGRLNRALAEANVGISEGLHFDSAGHTPGSSHLTLLDQELRWPILWEILTSYLLPFDLGRGQEAGRLIFFSGARVHELVTNQAPTFWGVELETAAVALTLGRGAYPLYVASPELRLYVGVADSAAAIPNAPHAWGPMVSVALTGGYATFF